MVRRNVFIKAANGANGDGKMKARYFITWVAINVTTITILAATLTFILTRVTKNMWNREDTGFLVLSVNGIIVIFGGMIIPIVIDLISLIYDYMVYARRGKEIPEKKQIYWY
jgi:hypothetical protein